MIYKAVFGNFDEVLPMPINGARKVLFSDRPVNVDGWELITLNCHDPFTENRKLKMFPWKYFDVDYSIYLDGRLDIKQPFFDFLMKKDLKGKMFLPIHRNRGDVLDELIRCINHRRISAEQLRMALELAKLDGKAVECGLIIRDHNSPGIRGHAQRWMDRFSKIGRDQPAFHDFGAAEFFEALDFDLSNDSYFNLRNHRLSHLKQIERRLRLAMRVILEGRVI